MQRAPRPTPTCADTSARARTRRTGTTRRVLAAGTVALLAASGLAACGGGDESSSTDVSDELAERLAEAGAGEGADVEVDPDSGEIDVSTEDGDLSIGSGELPEGFPSDIPLPDEYQVTSSFSSGTAAEEAYNVTGTITGGGADAFDALATAFTDAGWNESYRNTGDYDGGASSSAMFDKDGLQVIVAVQTADDADTTFSYTVTRAAS